MALLLQMKKQNHLACKWQNRLGVLCFAKLTRGHNFKNII